jgi:hypothetical protein
MVKLGASRRVDKMKAGGRGAFKGGAHAARVSSS